MSEVRQFYPGMGQAVAERTILRRKENGDWETWVDVAHRVALGNSLLCQTRDEQKEEYEILKKHLLNANTIMSGRHLQHGDETQPTKTMEVFTNCSTACNSFSLFFLLMSGCFRKGTLIKMADNTFKPIEEVKINDLVWSYDENKKKFITSIVEKVHENNPKPMVKVTFDDDTFVVCTEDHLFLTKNNGWVKAVDLDGEELTQKVHGLKGRYLSEEHKQKMRDRKRTESHNINLKNSLNRLEVKEKRKKTMKDKYGVEQSFHVKRNSVSAIEYWESKGFTEEEAKQKISEMQKYKASLVKNRKSHWTESYWIEKGFTVEEAKEKISKLQKHNNNLKLEQNTSKVATTFLNELEKLIHKKITREHKIEDKFTVDGIILEDNIIIEYFGDFWHMNPLQFQPMDKNPKTGRQAQSQWNEDNGRIKYLQKMGYKVFVIWENEANIEKINKLAEVINEG